jgi:hypothetical protein
MKNKIEMSCCPAGVTTDMTSNVEKVMKLCREHGHPG